MKTVYSVELCSIEPSSSLVSKAIEFVLIVLHVISASVIITTFVRKSTREIVHCGSASILS